MAALATGGYELEGSRFLRPTESVLAERLPSFRGRADRPRPDYSSYSGASLLVTFLELARTRHFGKAAEHLFVTQSAVSARIRLLEATLGVALFTRKRNDIRLTRAGERLQRHAETIVRCA
jgi:hypothetical protein